MKRIIVALSCFLSINTVFSKELGRKITGEELDIYVGKYKLITGTKNCRQQIEFKVGCSLMNPLYCISVGDSDALIFPDTEINIALRDHIGEGPWASIGYSDDMFTRKTIEYSEQGQLIITKESATKALFSKKVFSYKQYGVKKTGKKLHYFSRLSEDYVYENCAYLEQ